MGADAAGLIPGYQPETELERRITSDPVLLEGLTWGRPRAGHQDEDDPFHAPPSLFA